MTERPYGMPERVKVGPYDFTVEVWTPIQANAANRYGECSTMELTIRVQAGMAAAKTADTFLHEVLHAAWWVWGLEDEDKQERTVNALATALTAIWRDNPGLAAWLDRCASGRA